MIQGSCHCGTVKWRFEGMPESATACNCTICRRYGGLWIYGYEGQNVDISGAADVVPVITVTNLARSLRDMKESGIWIVLPPDFHAELSVADTRALIDVLEEFAEWHGAEIDFS